MRGPAIALGLAFAAAGCATKADVQTLETSMVQEMSQIRDDLGRLLNQMQAALDSLDAAEARRATTGRGELDRRVRRLEDAMAELLEVSTQNGQILDDLLHRVSSGSTLAPPRGGAGPAGLSSPGGAEPPVTTTGDEASATQFYALALEQFRTGNLETARGAFEDFLAQFPRHELAPDAQFYLAQTWEQGGDRAMALLEYARVTELYPDSNRAPSALYRRGLLEVEAGNTALARRLFTQVESGYPNSPEAPLARQELQKLGG